MAESKYVVFSIGSELFGLEIEFTERILTAQKETRIPRSPAAMLGLFDLRGRTIPVFDLALRLDYGQPSKGGNDVVVADAECPYALRVDQVVGIVTLTEENQEDADEQFTRRDDPFVSGIGKWDEKLILLLNPEALLPSKLRAKAEKLAQAA
ncbi:MAG: chemotaxis protein CheW [Armatimonadota bacterium]|jgi:purine-binding chemotaxis protein CheW|nr:chemotaxis protein CheW [Fimbriimonadaceae bacterium]MCZ8139777.1 chemotaxis protein CheW [Fimbriimonadaceae bacterium]